MKAEKTALRTEYWRPGWSRFGQRARSDGAYHSDGARDKGFNAAGREAGRVRILENQFQFCGSAPCRSG